MPGKGRVGCPRQAGGGGPVTSHPQSGCRIFLVPFGQEGILTCSFDKA